VKIKETTGSTQTSRPFTIGRFFAKGEIVHYPRPSISGTALSAWQSDVKTRWRDATANFAITNATNASPIVITTSSSHGFQEADQVTIAGVGGNTGANGTWWVSPVSSTTFSLHGSNGNGGYTGGGTVSGPTEGSVQHAIISFPLTITGNSTTQVDFIDDVNPSQSGNAAATLAAAVTKVQLQNWDIGGGAGNWGATTSLINGTTKTIDLKTILTACSISADPTTLGCRYWIAGPVLTQIIIEDRSSARAYDSGFATGNPIHPWFIVSAYSGYAGLKIDYVMENDWVGNTVPTGMQMVDDAYQVVMKKGSPLATWYTFPSSGTFNHWARTRYRETAWQGTTPGSVWIDYNMPYVTYSGMSYNYDTSFALPSSYWDPANSAAFGQLGGYSEPYLFSQSDGGTDPNAMGSISYRSYGIGGAHNEYGLDDRFDVAWMYSWAAGLTDPNARLMENVMAGNSEVLGHVNIHFRENLTGRTFCPSTNNCIAAGVTSVDAYGKPVSIDARPNMWYFAQNSAANSSAPAVDQFPIASLQAFSGANVDSLKGFAYELSHAWDINYLRYILTGDYYHLEELWFQPALGLGVRNPDNAVASRHGTWGFAFDENRGGAWMMKFLSRAALVSPTGTPEKLYYREKLANNLAVREGWMGLTTGAFYEPQTTSRWYWARNTVAASQPNPLAMQFPPECYYNFNVQDPTQTYANLQTWTQNLNVGVWMQTADMGFSEARALGNYLITKHLLHQIIDPAYNPYLIAVEEEPMLVGDSSTCAFSWPTSTHPFFTTFAAAKASFLPVAQAMTAFNDGQGTLTSSQSAEWNYGLIGLAASSFLPGLSDGTLNGQTAYDFMKTNMPDQNLTHLVPRLAIVPRNPQAPIAPSWITTSPLSSGTQTVPYTFQMSALGTGPITYTATGLPSWATLDTTGLLHGTPTTVGTTTISITATNSVGSVGPTGFVLSINPPTAPTVTTLSLPVGSVSIAYATTLTASGTPPITWSIISGTLPSWATLTAATGVISGIPDATATTSFTVRATNSVGVNDKALSITINPTPVPPTITSASLPTGFFGYAYSYTFTATGDASTWTATGLPTWASLSSTGVLHGTPDTVNVSTINVVATNDAGMDTKNFTLTILATPPETFMGVGYRGGTIK
jgi:hypothetical protein